MLDVGCGPGHAALLLAAEADAEVVAIDTHQPFLDEHTAAARARGLAEQVTAENLSMAALEGFPDGAFDLVWAEGSAYVIGFEEALRSWRRLLAPSGVLVLTELEWTTPRPSDAATEFWHAAYPLQSHERNRATAEAAGYHVAATRLSPDEDWWSEYYDPLSRRLERADREAPGMAEVASAVEAEIDLRGSHGDEYGYMGYVLRRGGGPTAPRR